MMVEIHPDAQIAIYPKDNNKSPYNISALDLRKQDWAELGESECEYEDDPIFIIVDFAHVKYDDAKQYVQIDKAHNYEVLAYGCFEPNGDIWVVPANKVNKLN